MASFIDVQGISKSFQTAAGRRDVLRDVSLSVEHGEFIAIVGAMGSGKSTLLSIIAGLMPPDGGTITIGGEPVRGIRTDGSFVFQHYSLLPWFSALENVRLAVEAAFPQLSRDEQCGRARTALESVGLGNALTRRPRQLSGGMRQRVAIARALATEPTVLFLDEPFGALDAVTRETLQHELARLCAEADRPVTVIMITNNVEEAILLSDRIVPIVPGPPACPEPGRGAGPWHVRGATLGAAIDVALPRPRSASQLAHDEQATQVRSHVVATLTAAMHRPRAASLHRPGEASLHGPAPEGLHQPAREGLR
jgi:nitrate/nitrite transport system ATP-binding protein